MDGPEVARTTVKMTVPAAFTASESFDVGTDLGSRVSRDYLDRRPLRFDGKIKRLRVILKESVHFRSELPPERRWTAMAGERRLRRCRGPLAECGASNVAANVVDLPQALRNTSVPAEEATDQPILEFISVNCTLDGATAGY